MPDRARIPDLALDAIEVVNNAGVFSRLYDAWAALRNVEWMLPVTAGSDAHDVWYLGSAFTTFPGHEAAALRVALEAGRTRAGWSGRGRRRRCRGTCTSSRGAPSGSYKEVTVDTHERTGYEGPELRWLERGRGEPMILLHGLMGQMHHWDAVLEGLDDGYRAIALTLPIFGRALGEASLGALARHVVAFMDALEMPRAIVGGNSLGGHVALRVALEHRDRVTGLLLTGSSGLFERGFSSGVPHRPDRRWVREKMEEVFFDPSLVTEGWVDEAHRVVTTPASAVRVLRLARDARRDNLEARLGLIRVPTLLVWGREDRITPPEVGERFRELIPDAQLTCLARCGHAPMLEQPEEFADVVADWLEDTRDRRGLAAPALGGVR